MDRQPRTKGITRRIAAEPFHEMLVGNARVHLLPVPCKRLREAPGSSPVQFRHGQASPAEAGNRAARIPV
jgi:hypothetical protein